MATDPTNPSVGELVAQLTEQTGRLVRDEVDLAKTELRESVRHVGVGVGLFGASGLLALLGLATLVAAAVAGLALVVDVWLAALIVGLALLVVAGLGGLLGTQQVKDTGTSVPQNLPKDVDALKGKHS